MKHVYETCISLEKIENNNGVYFNDLGSGIFTYNLQLEDNPPRDEILHKIQEVTKNFFDKDLKLIEVTVFDWLKDHALTLKSSGLTRKHYGFSHVPRNESLESCSNVLFTVCNNTIRF